MHYDKRICEAKRRHPDELLARAAAMRAIEIHNETDRLWVYQCPECRGWHLTKRNNGIGKMVTADNPIHQ